jgi:phosphodiesterase/alkaline phosphatase D-like protein
MLGAEQLSWIEQGLLNSTSQWKFVISEVPITQYFAFPYDGWEGYSYERNQLLSFIQDNDIKNVVFLATDVHANWAARVYEDIGQDHTPIAYEVASGPIQTCTLGCEADRLLGAGGGDNLLQFEKFRGLIDVDCADIDTYAYSTTTVPANAQSLHMVWRTNKKAKSGGGKLLAGCDEQLLVDTLPQH